MSPSFKRNINWIQVSLYFSIFNWIIFKAQKLTKITILIIFWVLVFLQLYFPCEEDLILKKNEPKRIVFDYYLWKSSDGLEILNWCIFFTRGFQNVFLRNYLKLLRFVKLMCMKGLNILLASAKANRVHSKNNQFGGQP